MQVQALDSLAKALHVEVLELRRERARALSSRGLWGHLKNLLGYLLSAYCLFKYDIFTSDHLVCSKCCKCVLMLACLFRTSSIYVEAGKPIVAKCWSRSCKC